MKFVFKILFFSIFFISSVKAFDLSKISISGIKLYQDYKGYLSQFKKSPEFKQGENKFSFLNHLDENYFMMVKYNPSTGKINGISATHLRKKVTLTTCDDISLASIEKNFKTFKVSYERIQPDRMNTFTETKSAYIYNVYYYYEFETPEGVNIFGYVCSYLKKNKSKSIISVITMFLQNKNQFEQELKINNSKKIKDFTRKEFDQNKYRLIEKSKDNNKIAKLPNNDKKEIIKTKKPINPKNFRKFYNLINYKVDKKKIKINEAEALLATNIVKPEFRYNSIGKKYSTNIDVLNKNIYRYFVENSEKHNLLYPGDIFVGLINLEILYRVKLYKKEKTIRRYIENTYKGKKWFTMFNDRETVRSLIQLNESIDSIRENFGIDKKKSTAEVIKTYEAMSEFLNNDEYKLIKKDWKSKEERKRKLLMEKYLGYLNQINKTLKDAEKNI